MPVKDRTHYNLSQLGAKLPSEGSGRLPARLLIIDGDAGDYPAQLATHLAGCLVRHASSLREGYEIFLHAPVDLLLVDHHPAAPCFELLQLVKATRPRVPVIVLTAAGSEEVAVRAFRSGARDYFTKPLAVDELELSIRAILGVRGLPMEIAPLVADRGLQRVLLYLQRNYLAGVSLEQAATEARMSQSAFCRLFKAETGLTLSAYLNDLRIGKARELLAEHHLSLLEIALASGFSNQCHFIRTFKKLTSMTPGQYRKKLRPWNGVPSPAFA